MPTFSSLKKQLDLHELDSIVELKRYPNRIRTTFKTFGISKEDIAPNKAVYDKNTGNLLALAIQSLPEGVSEIIFEQSEKHLQYLNISGNPHKENGFLALKKLIFQVAMPDLELCYLNHCCLEELDFPKGFDKLRQLYLQQNQLKSLRLQGKLPALQWLDVSNNQLQDLTTLRAYIEKEVRDTNPAIGKDVKVYFEKNPLVKPPMEVVEQGYEAILRYFSSELRTHYEAKILMVGEPEAGKTTLTRKLTIPNYQVPPPKKEDSTIGIQVSDWATPHLTLKDKEIKVKIWDFGGQEIQYLTHQFFLTADALYILLTSSRKDLDNLDYWFHIIGLLGKNEKQENSELLVVANEINMERVTHFEPSKFEKNHPHLPFRFLDVNLATSCDAQGRFEVVHYAIREMLGQLAHVAKGTELPIQWGIVREELQKLKRNYITTNEYFTICEAVGIEEAFALNLSTYLHKVGDIIHFQEDCNVQDLIILNPQWAVDAVYVLLKDADLINKGGHFTRNEVYKIWEKRYSFEERGHLLRLMTKDNFEVAYSLPDKPNEYIAPQLLPNKKVSYSWENKEALRFRYSYPFMPKGILTRMIVRLHELIFYNEKGEGRVWKSGVVLQNHGCKVQIIEAEITETDVKRKVIDMEVIGNKMNRKMLLHDVCKELETIHKTIFANLTVERQVPCICSHCQTLEIPHFYNYSELIEYLKEGIDKIRCPKKVKNELLVVDLLQDIFDLDFTTLHKGFSSEMDFHGFQNRNLENPFGVLDKKRRTSSLKVFISYSQTEADKAHVVQLEKHLAMLKHNNWIETWSSNNLLAGEEQANKQVALEKADIILLLVSADYLASDEIMQKEVPLAMNRWQKGNAKVVPIILSVCEWRESIFGDLTPLPNREKAITSYEDKDEAWLEITKGIRAVVEKKGN